MKAHQKRVMGSAVFSGILFLILASPSSALELLTYRSYFPSGNVELEYTYYLDTAGQHVLHGTRTWYRTPLEVGVIERYSHGKKHGLEEAWYADSYTYGRSKHWEKEYQDGLLHGVSRYWYQETNTLQGYETYRYGKLHGPSRGYTSANLYDRLTMEADYQDGLLHGHCKTWVVKYVSGYWTRYEHEEGDYAYGKKQGHWKTWCTTDNSSSNWSNPKNEGDYGNNVQCGRWTNYYCPNWIVAPTYTNYGDCTSALPPGAGTPLPGGNQYEIRGHVTDRNTNLPLAGVTVQAGPASGVSDAEGFYTVALDSGGTLTLNAVKSGYYDFSRTVNLIAAQYLDVAIAMKPEEAGGKPVITNVDPRAGTFFIQGIENLSSPVENEYAVSVNWNGGQPGIVKFEVNGTPFEVTGTPSGASKTFDMNTDFPGSLSPIGNTLKITAVNAEGLESRPETLNPIVIPLPSWAMKFGDEFEIKQDGKHRVYKLDTKWPEKPIEVLISESYLGSTLWTLWGFVPFVGGKTFGIPGTQSFLTIEAKTDGTGSIAAGGMSGFEAAGGKIEIKLGGKGNLKYEPNVGLEWKETSLILGIKGTVEDTAGVVTVIPALAGAVNLPLIGGAIGWFNKRAQIKATLTANTDTALEIMSATGEIGFSKADLETGIGVELGMEATVVEGLKAEIKGGDTVKVNWQVPANPDYFKQLSMELAASITLKILGFEYSENYTYPFTHPEAAEPGAVRRAQSIPALSPLSRDFLNYGPYNVPVEQQSGTGTRRTMDGGGAGANTQDRLIQNVFPYSEPAIAVKNISGFEFDTIAIAYVYLDPSKPVHRDTDIYFTRLTGYNTGTLFQTTTPVAPIKSDTRAEYAPTIAHDASGRIVCVWQRVKNPEFPADGTLAQMAAEMEIVYAFYNGTTWSEPVALTDNGYMDFNPILKRSADNKLMLVWLSNEGNQLIGDAAYPTTVHYALWNATNATFGTPSTLPQTFADCFRFSLAYSGTEATLAYVRDMDGNLATINDQEIFYTVFNGTAWADPIRVTTDEVPDANPKVVYRSGTRELIWLRGDAMVRLTALGPTLELQTIRENVTAAGLIDFGLYTDTSATNGKMVLLWQDSDAKGVNLFYSVYDATAGVWGNVLRLTESPAMDKDFQVAFGWPNLYQMVFNRKDRTTGVTDLYHKTFSLATDLAVTPADLSVVDPGTGEPVNPNPGDHVTLKCRVTNRGDLAVANPKVTFRLGSASGTILPGGTTVSVVPATLKAGESGVAELAWTVPSDVSQTTVFAVVSTIPAVTELLATNNTASFDVIKSDLKAVRCIPERRPDGTLAIRAEIRNDGLKPAENVAVAFKAQDTIFGTITIPGILPGKSADLVLPARLDLYSYTSLSPRISVTADPDNLIQENDEGNNTASFIHSLETVLPAIQNFGQVHYQGAMGTVAVFNKTTAGLAIGAISIAGPDAGDFRIFDALGGTTIQPQQSALLGIEFIPTSLGVKNAVLLIRDNQGKVLWQVPLTGQLDFLIRGDLNDDGNITLADAILALKAVSGLRPAGAYAVVGIDADGKIGLAEVIYILQKTAELRD